MGNIKYGVASARTLVTRWCAYGDLIVALPLIEALSRTSQYLHFESGERARDLVTRHWAIDRLTTFDVMKHGKEHSAKAANDRYIALREAGDWQKEVLLWRTLEVECIAEEWQEEYFWPREKRREHFGSKVFSEAPFGRAGFTIPDPFDCGSLIFDPLQLGMMRTVLDAEKEEKPFRVGIIIAGSTCQKVPYGYTELMKAIKSIFPDTLFYTMGQKQSGWMPTPIDMEKRQPDFGEGTVMKLVGKHTWGQMAATLASMDFVVGPISGPANLANLLGIPKSIICTDCSPYQAFKYGRNDMSIQSDAACSPCHRAIYHTKYCLTQDLGDGPMPLCNMQWNKQKVIEAAKRAYEIREYRHDFLDRFLRSGVPTIHTMPERISKQEDYVRPPFNRHGLYIADWETKRFSGKYTIIEIGSSRHKHPKEGWGTPYFAWLSKTRGWDFYTVDINPVATKNAVDLVNMMNLNHEGFHAITGDGVEFLKNYKNKDVVISFLDAWDYGPSRFPVDNEKFNDRSVLAYSEEMHLETAKLVDPLMVTGGIVIVDDLVDLKTAAGKGTLAYPWLMQNGYESLWLGREYVTRKVKS